MRTGAPPASDGPPRDNRTITVDKLAAYPDRVDVRSPSEFAEDHIPGAISAHVLDNDERARIGIPDGLVRLSVGIESAEDIVADLDQALGKI